MHASTAFRAFSAPDLATLAALQSHRRLSGWRFHCDRADAWDVISVQPPTVRRVHDPLYCPPCYLIIPAEKSAGTGVLMTKPDGRTEAAYASLADALGDIGGPGVSWKRALRRN